MVLELLAFRTIVTGSIYGLTAVGWGYIYRVTRRFHYAFALTFTLAAYVAAPISAGRGIGTYLGILAGLMVAMVAGLICEAWVYRPIERRVDFGNPFLPSFIASVGITLAGEALLGLLTLNTSAETISGLPHAVFVVGGVTMRLWDLLIIFVAWLLLGLFTAVLRWSEIGRRVRAVRSNRELCKLFGIVPEHTYWFVFAAGSLFSGVAGIMVTGRSAAETTMGNSAVLYAFVVAFIAGQEAGPLILGLVGLALAVATTFSAVIIPPIWTSAVTFTAVFILVALRGWGPRVARFGATIGKNVMLLSGDAAKARKG